MDKIFLGGMVLDLSDRTRKSQARDLINLITLPFDNILVRDIAKDDQDTPAFEARLTMEEDVVSGYTFIATSTPVNIINLQNKNSQVISFCVGDITNKDKLEDFIHRSQPIRSTSHAKLSDPSELIGQMLLRVNVSQHIADDNSGVPPEFNNYTHRVKSRLTDVIEGDWAAFSIFSSTQRSTIAMTSSGSASLLFTLVAIDNCLILVWSNAFDAIRQVLDNVKDDEDAAYLKHTWSANLSVFQDDKSTLVIHPIFLLNKVRFFGQRTYFDTLRIAQLLEKYMRSGAY